MPLVSITRLRVRSFRYLPAFFARFAALGARGKNRIGKPRGFRLERRQSRILEPMSEQCVPSCLRPRIAA
jgi:hypothetical protein